jgi:preprotein translocase subunit SecA
MIGVEMEGVAQEFYQEKVLSADWDWQAIDERLQGILGFIPEWQDTDKQDLTFDRFAEKLQEIAEQAYAAQEETIGTEGLRYLERVILLQIVDTHWKEHLLNLDHLKEGIGLRGYGQKNPLQEYKKEGFEMFSAMIETIREKTISTLFMIKIASEDDVDREALEKRKRQQSEMRLSRGRDAEQAQQPLKREGEKIGRNSPCPCGSGKKYKKCCGRAK